jgi:hypothetical protein
MKKSYLLILFSLLLIPATVSFGQFFIEDFDYSAGDSLTQHGWVAHSGTSNAIFVTSPGLTYLGYGSSGIGNAATLTTTGQDVNKQYTPLTSGAVYASFMVKVSSAQTGDYFFHLGLSNTTSIYMGRVYVKLASNGNLAFGLSKTSLGGALAITAVYSDSIYTTGTTYLLVLKYQFNPDVNDDVAYLFINPVVSATEPTPNLTHSLSNASDPADIGGVYIRQGTASSAPNLSLDGIRIGTAWADVVPVELTSFVATSLGSDVTLNWSTASELNNFGFEIERSLSGNEFTTIGFVSGFGTTTETKSYRFVDGNLTSGNYSYRLKQVDFDGSFSYSNVVNVDVSAPVKFELSQNYPNPFNPSTTINFSIPQSSNVSLRVFNTLGQEVKTLINQYMVSGSHSITFDATDLNSGIYFYRLEAGQLAEVRKMTLIK